MGRYAALGDLCRAMIREGVQLREKNRHDEALARLERAFQMSRDGGLYPLAISAAAELINTQLHMFDLGKIDTLGIALEWRDAGMELLCDKCHKWVLYLRSGDIQMRIPGSPQAALERGLEEYDRALGLVPPNTSGHVECLYHSADALLCLGRPSLAWLRVQEAARILPSVRNVESWHLRIIEGGLLRRRCEIAYQMGCYLKAARAMAGVVRCAVDAAWLDGNTVMLRKLCRRFWW